MVHVEKIEARAETVPAAEPPREPGGADDQDVLGRDAAKLGGAEEEKEEVSSSEAEKIEARAETVPVAEPPWPPGGTDDRVTLGRDDTKAVGAEEQQEEDSPPPSPCDPRQGAFAVPGPTADEDTEPSAWVSSAGIGTSQNFEVVTTATLVSGDDFVDEARRGDSSSSPEPELVVAEKLDPPEPSRGGDAFWAGAANFLADRRVRASLVLVLLISIAIAVAVPLATRGVEVPSPVDLKDGEEEEELSGTPAPTPAPTRASSASPSAAPTFSPTRTIWELAGGRSLSAPRGSFRFGEAVAVSADGSRLAVGAPEPVGSFTGRVHVYELGDGGGWDSLGGAIETGAENFGKSVAMSGDGKRVAVGTSEADGADGVLGDQVGMVQVFEYSGSSAGGDVAWTPLGDPIYGEGEDDRIHQISISEDGARMALGAGLNDADSNNTSLDVGHLRIFEWDEDGESWNQVGPDIDGTFAEEYFGFSVAMGSDGNCVAAGAPGGEERVVDDDVWAGAAQGNGYVLVLSYDDGSDSWIPMGQQLDGQGMERQTGYSVAVSSECSHVAFASRIYTADQRVGQVKVFHYVNSDTQWVQVGQTITFSDGKEPQRDDLSRLSLSMSRDGTRLAVGAPFYDGNAGFVALYDFKGNTWHQRGARLRNRKIDQSGFAVSLSRDGQRVAVGSSDDESIDSITKQTGHVSVYELRDA